MLKVVTIILAVILIAALAYLFIGFSALALAGKIMYLVLVLVIVAVLIALVRKWLRGH